MLVLDEADRCLEVISNYFIFSLLITTIVFIYLFWKKKIGFARELNAIVENLPKKRFLLFKLFEIKLFI